MISFQDWKTSYLSNIKTNPKIYAICLNISVVFIIYSYYTSYPIFQPDGKGIVYQFPIVFWFGILIGFISLTAITNYSNRPIVALLTTGMFYLIFNSYRISYFNYIGGDNSTIISWALQLSQWSSLPTRGSPEYFDYLQWPIHHLIIMNIQEIFDTDILSTTDLGYLIYIFLFAMSVYTFVYEYSPSQDPFYLFSASILYLVIVYNWLNDQFVPQLIALIVLFFLFSITNKFGKYWLVMKLGLFITLLLAHPFIFIFYIIPITLLPGMYALYNTLSSPSDQYLVRTIVYSPVRIARNSHHIYNECINQYHSRVWLQWMTIISTTYVSLLVYRFITLPTTVYIFGFGSDPTNRPNLITILGSILPETVKNWFPSIFSGTEVTGSSTPQLNPHYEFVSPELYQLTLYGAMGLVLTIFLVCIGTYLFAKLQSLSPWAISILFGSSLYFLTGTFIQLLASRALQVAFLPLTLMISILERRPSIGKALILCLIISSPLLIGNTLVNHTVSAGGNSNGYYSTQASIHAENYTNMNAIVPHNNGIPPISNENVVSIADVRDGLYNISKSDLIVDSPTVSLYLSYTGYECNLKYDYGNEIYDNGGATVNWNNMNNRPNICHSNTNN